MNVFAHVAVAARAAGPGAEDRFLLGAALSDLATFGGFRLLGRSPDEVVRRGMAFHHHSDDAFHRHPWFRSRNGAAGEVLVERGLPRGAARACAHVGVELLLDGSLHHDRDDRTRFSRALAAVTSIRAELAPLVDAARQEAWLDHLGRLAGAPGPPRYTDPATVAHRLHAICARRPRLAFGAGEVAVVRSVLEDLMPSIHRSGPELVDELAAGLRDVAGADGGPGSVTTARPPGGGPVSPRPS